MSDRTNDANTSPEDIESRIESKQNDLKKDIDALEDKVSPENLKAQARERIDEAGDQVKEKAVDATKQVGDRVRDRIDDVSERFQQGDRMPSMSLIGLVAVIGIGLLLSRGSRGRHDRGHYTRHPDADYMSDRSRGPGPMPRAYQPDHRY